VIYVDGELHGDHRTEAGQLAALAEAAATGGEVLIAHWDRDREPEPGWTEPAPPEPTWKYQPVPGIVRQMLPRVTSWAWLSPLRLRGQRQQAPGEVYLVVVDQGRTDALGQGLSAAQAADAHHVRDTYARLRMQLMNSVARRDACRDGTPYCREDGRCRYCGLPGAGHDDPGASPGPVRQEAYLGWPAGQVVTAAGSEAARYADMEAALAEATGITGSWWD
jgi:hypothetical protein